ncbi:uncharacterized protein [Temnothorax longispinosus]|uniref:uncharacterized protein n=1 Tax=Temnothorax longispinosus TaxID=300112 RepID=UPI003A999F6D
MPLTRSPQRTTQTNDDVPPPDDHVPPPGDHVPPPGDHVHALAGSTTPSIYSDETDNMAHGGNGQEGHELNEIKALKLPQPFWRDSPARYFTVAEMTFALHRITSDDSKYRYVVIHLDTDLLGLVGDIIDSPPTYSKYEALKQRIIDSLSESQETKLRRLLRGQVMGDEKPSVFLQRLQNLAGGQCNDSVLRSLFMEQMPEHMRGILAISQLDDLATIAAQADRIARVTRPQINNINQASIGAVALPQDISAPGKTGPSSDIEELRHAVEALTRKFERTMRRRSRSRGRGGNRSRLTTPHQKDAQKYCYYHRKFGADAINCRPPCF